MADHDKNERYILHSVSTAFSILDLFFEHEELSPAEVARCISINRSTAFRFLVTMEQAGYLIKTDDARYRLGVKISSLGQVAHNRMELISVIHPFLVSLSEATGESSHLAIMDDATHITFIDKSVGTLWLTMDVTIGYSQYAHLTATGKAILAHKSDPFINQYIRSASFEACTTKSITDAGSLLRTLDAIRIQGYSIDNEEVEDGLYCIAVPILSRDSDPIASISISGPATRMIMHQDSHLQHLKNAVSQIERLIQ